MAVRTGLREIGLTGCLCLTIVSFISAGHSNAEEWQSRPRHSLVIRPAASVNTPASIAPSRHPEKSKPLSLVTPIQPARKKATLTSSMPSVAESGTATFSATEAGQVR